MSWQFAGSSNYKDNKEREHALIGNHEKLLLLAVRKRTNNLRPMFSNYIQRYKNIDNSFNPCADIYNDDPTSLDCMKQIAKDKNNRRYRDIGT